MNARTAMLVLGLAVPLLGACARSDRADAPVATMKSSGTASVAAAPATPATASVTAPTHGAALPVVLVHKSPTCGCCTAWVEHMRKAGFTVQVDDREELEPLKKRLGVPLGKGSCHTAEIDGLVIEGHVPAEDIKRLLAARGDARGLVLPGMPMGSPGMDVPGGQSQRYTVEKINADGSTSPFATHGE